MRNKWLLTVLIMIACLSLWSQSNKPRVLYVLICEADGGSLLNDTSKLRFFASLFNVTRDSNYYDFGYYHAGGNLYAKIQLANFDTEWYPGDVVKLEFTRQDTLYTHGLIEIVVPEGTETIWWGRPDTAERSFPGGPVRLYPFILNVEAQDPGIPVLINGKATALVTGTPFTAKTKDDITGIFSLAPPPSGWRWEPSKYVLTPRDFEFSESAYTDAEGVSRPGWARTLEFRLVPSDPEG